MKIVKNSFARRFFVFERILFQTLFSTRLLNQFLDEHIRPCFLETEANFVLHVPLILPYIPSYLYIETSLLSISITPTINFQT